MKNWEASLTHMGLHVATPLWGKCEDEIHTPESGDLESSGTPTTLEFNCRSQNTSPWGVLYIDGKVSKCKCWKWPCMSHQTSTTQVMVKRRARSQTGSLIPNHKKSRIDPTPGRAEGVWHNIGKLLRRATSLLQIGSCELPKSWESKPGQFRE
jgi:hypothetical protein